MRRGGTVAGVQAISGLAFFVFAAGHFVNTMAAALGADAYDGFQARARVLYQSPIIEIGLFAALTVHIVAAVLAMRARRGQPRATGAGRVHRYAGRILALAIVGHVACTRGPSLLADVYPGFSGIAYTIIQLPAVSYPYFALLIACGILHAGYGAWKAVGALAGRSAVAPPRALTIALVAGIGLSWLGILGLGGRLYAIEDPANGRFAALVQRLLSGSAATSAHADARTPQPSHLQP